MAEEQHKVIISVSADTTEAQQEVKQLKDGMQELGNVPVDKSVKTLKQEFKEAQDQASRFLSQLKQAEDELEQLSKSASATPDEIAKATARVKSLSDSFAEAGQRTAGLRNDMDELRNSVANFNPDNKLQAIVGISRAAVGAVQGVAGAFTLIGVEAEDANKIIAKLQGLAALSDMINSVDDIKDAWKNLGTVIQGNTVLTKANAVANTVTAGAMRALGVSAQTTSLAFQALKAAIIATGIGALVIGITTLIPIIQNWISGTEDAEEAQRNLESAVKSLNEELDINLRAIDRNTKRQIDFARIAGKTQEQIAGIERQGLVERANTLKAASEQMDRTVDEAIKNGNVKSEELQKLQEDKRKKYSDYLGALAAIEDKDLKDRADKAEENRKKAKDASDKADAEAKANASKRDAERKARAEKEKAEREAALKEIEAMEKDASKRILQNNMTDREIELDNLQRDFEKKKAQYDKYGKDTNKLVQAYNLDRKAIEDKYAKEITDFLASRNQDEFGMRRADIQKEYEKYISEATDFATKLKLIYSMGTELGKVTKEEVQQQVLKNLDTNVTNTETNLIRTERENIVSDDDTPEQRKAKLENVYKAQVEAENAEHQRKKAAAIGNAAELALIEEQHLTTLNNLHRAKAEEEIAIDEAKKAAKLANMEAVGSALNSFSEIVGKQTVAGKAMAVASASIDTYAGATKALAAYPPPFNYIAAAAVVATGLANIKKIVSTKVPGKSDSISTPTAAQITQAPVINATQLNQQTQDVRVVNQQDQIVRAFIVDKDLTKQQEKTDMLNKFSII